MAAPESAKEAYDHYAPVYDETNAQNNYELWLGETLLPELEKHGLRKDWALDVGCGTGRAFDPLLERGWRVIGCDVSPGMLAEARRKFPQIQLFESDARDLPAVPTAEGESPGEAFSLVLLLNDVVNYLIDDGDLEKVFAGVKRNLSRDRGLVVFDANALALFRAGFSANVEDSRPGGWDWHGLTEEPGPGVVHEASLSAPGMEPQVHRQRHWPIDEVRGALEASGLRCLAVLGQSEQGGRIFLSEQPDEERDAKIIYVAAHGPQE